MSLLTTTDLKSLIRAHEKPCVSLYMPTHRKGREIEQDPIRLKNLLKTADERLRNKGLKQPEIDDMLRPARDLLEHTPFWQHQSDGLALFLCRRGSRHYRLPTAFEELVVVSERYHIKPLLPCQTEEK